MRTQRWLVLALLLATPLAAESVWQPNPSEAAHLTLTFKVRPCSLREVWVHFTGAADVDVRWVSFVDRPLRILQDDGSVTEQRAQIDIAHGYSDTIETARGAEVTYLYVEVSDRRDGRVVDRRAMRFINDGNPRPAPKQGQE